MKNNSLLSIATAVLGVWYSFTLLSTFYTGDMTGSVLMLPHTMIVLAATILSVILVFKDKKGLRISVFVMWCVAIVSFLLYLIFMLPMFILSLIKMIKGEKK